MRVAVIGGGENCEHDVSLASAASVRDALRENHEVVEVTIARDGSWRDARGPLPLSAVVTQLQACDVVFPVVHGCGARERHVVLAVLPAADHGNSHR